MIGRRSIATKVGNEMQELNQTEIEMVSGAGFWATVGYALGFATGCGAAMQEHINDQGNPMLSAMALGA